MKTFGAIIKLITFPGAFLHMFWEQLTCNLYDARVEQTMAVQLNEMCGHVEHDFMKTRGEQFLVCFLPFLFNLLLGALLSGTAIAKLFVLGEETAVFYIMLWTGGSLLTNLFPLIEDAMKLWERIFFDETPVSVKILYAPICAVLYGGAYLNTYGVTLFTTAGLFSLCLI